jgi:uncharacterized protein (DUF1810 family)
MTDPYHLQRFISAQETTYAVALREIRSGRKRSHWMWFIFPQLAGLGRTDTARHYAIRSLDEARAYLAHPLLGPRLLEITEALLTVQGTSATDLMGQPDDLKLRSCLTLFASANPQQTVFQRALDAYFGGQPDRTTLRLLDHPQPGT